MSLWSCFTQKYEGSVQFSPSTYWVVRGTWEMVQLISWLLAFWTQSTTRDYIGAEKTHFNLSLCCSAHQSFNTNHSVSTTHLTYFTHIRTQLGQFSREPTTSPYVKEKVQKSSLQKTGGLQQRWSFIREFYCIQSSDQPQDTILQSAHMKSNQHVSVKMLQQPCAHWPCGMDVELQAPDSLR